MKKYRVNVNGTNYDITLEEIKGDFTPAAAPAPTAAPAPVAETPAPAPAAAPAPVAAGGEQIKSPLTGTILDVKIANGQAVKKGDVIMVLEAMKMENEIFAPVDGTVASVNVTKGTAVDNGTLLCVIA